MYLTEKQKQISTNMDLSEQTIILSCKYNVQENNGRKKLKSIYYITLYKKNIKTRKKKQKICIILLLHYDYYYYPYYSLLLLLYLKYKQIITLCEI